MLKNSMLRNSLRKALLLFLILVLGISVGYLTNHVFSDNAKFEAFTEQIFRTEVSGSTLTLHYSLANPGKQGITPPAVTLGTVNSDMGKTDQLLDDYEQGLRSFSYSKLSQKNRLTLDMLLLYFRTQRSLGKNYLLEEYLGPSLGVQAQLPVLLAEYAFYTDEDISDYLKLLGQVQPYFESILEFERKKSKAGFFMSDATLDRILKQCENFVKEPDSNYMLDIFARKIRDYGKFDEAEQAKLCTYHEKLLKSQVIPAYQTLMKGLDALRGTGRNSQGLVYFKGGRDFYRCLIQSQTGSYVPVEKIEKRLMRQLMTDYREISGILKNEPSLVSSLTALSDSIKLTPQEMLKELQILMIKDFPKIEAPPYELRYVHDSMKDFLSPAFYLTPPMDTGEPNVIYINNGKPSSSLELFGTLAHEGFPGHLYQTVSFGRQNPSHIRYLLNNGGFVEGWATYVESYAYQYASSLTDDPAAKKTFRLAWLNRSMNLCIYSLIDIGIHYRGWDEARTGDFLKAFGIRNPSAISDIYRYIVETPANYLKYYWGYLNFLDLKKSQMNQLGDAFNLKEFHQQILNIGPVQFPVLKKYLQEESKEFKRKEELPAGSSPLVIICTY